VRSMLSAALAGAAMLACAGTAAAAPPLTVSSSDPRLVDGLDWAQAQALSWARTGGAFETALVADAPAGATNVKVAVLFDPPLTERGSTATLRSPPPT
jgi:hypothetical protein